MSNPMNPHYPLILEIILKIRSIESNLVEHSQKITSFSEDKVQRDLDRLLQEAPPPAVTNFPELCFSTIDQLNHIENVLTCIITGKEAIAQSSLMQLDYLFRNGQKKS